MIDTLDAAQVDYPQVHDPLTPFPCPSHSGLLQPLREHRACTPPQALPSPIVGGCDGTHNNPESESVLQVVIGFVILLPLSPTTIRRRRIAAAKCKTRGNSPPRLPFEPPAHLSRQLGPRLGVGKQCLRQVRKRLTRMIRLYHPFPLQSLTEASGDCRSRSLEPVGNTESDGFPHQ